MRPDKTSQPAQINGSKIDRMCAGFLRLFVTGILSLVGLAVAVVPVLIALNALIAPEPASEEIVRASRHFGVWFLPVSLIWFVACSGGIVALIWFIYRRRDHHDA